MHNDNKAELRRRINEACPELLKLEFGCEVIVSSCSEGCCGVEKWTIDSNHEIKDKNIFHKVYKDVFTVVEILGKPPELSHLLRTLPDTAEISIGIDSGIMAIQVNNRVFAYDLTKAPLDQNEEVIKALLTITV
jgi:hypothetical protein